LSGTRQHLKGLLHQGIVSFQERLASDDTSVVEEDGDMPNVRPYLRKACGLMLQIRGKHVDPETEQGNGMDQAPCQQEHRQQHGQ
jgi:hypothetical protein